MTSNKRYLHGHSPSVLRSHKWRTAENSAAYLLPNIKPTSTILDVGCGPGTISVDFADIVSPSGHVVGVDSAEGIVQSATSEHGKSRPNLTFQVADVTKGLPFADGTFDIVHAHQVMQYMTDPIAVLREMRRVCKSGGLIAVRDVDYQGTFWTPELPGMDIWIRRYVESVRRRGGDSKAGRNLLRYAKQAGFREVKASASVWCFSDKEKREWWGSLWAERVRDSGFAGDMRSNGVPESEIDEMSAAWKAWADHDAGLMIIGHGEILCTV